MDIAALPMSISTSKAEESAGIAPMKIAMDDGKEDTIQMTEIMKNSAAALNLGHNLDMRA